MPGDRRAGARDGQGTLRGRGLGARGRQEVLGGRGSGAVSGRGGAGSPASVSGRGRGGLLWVASELWNERGGSAAGREGRAVSDNPFGGRVLEAMAISPTSRGRGGQA